MLKSRIAAALIVGLSIAAPTQATTVSYYLNQSDKLADGINYLQVTISDEGKAGAIDFTVQALQPLLDLAGERFGLLKFAFNVQGGVSTEARNVTELPDKWRARNGGRMDGFGLFDITVKSQRHSKKTANIQDPLTFSITGVDFDTVMSYVGLSRGRAPEGFSLFSAQVTGINFGNCDRGKDDKRTPGGGRCIHSAYFGGDATAVPAPPAVWLLGTGIVGLVARRFRTAKATA